MRKRNFNLLIALLLSSVVLAQDKPSAKSGQPKQTSKPNAVVMTAKDTLLCKAWKPISIERFHVANKPEGTEKDDGVTFVLEGTVFLTMEGVQKTGTWITDKSKKWITLTFEGGTQYRFQIFNLTPTEFYYEYQDAELVRTKYKCEPAKK
ncbi:MAG: lipocalin family protein [Bacteroidia bacterium]|nr:lipocalin family protein [Bacteroidia bacterium]